jgi:hypothetical protein
MAAWAWEVSSQQVRRKNDELCRLSRITDYTRAASYMNRNERKASRPPRAMR